MAHRSGPWLGFYAGAQKLFFAFFGRGGGGRCSAFGRGRSRALGGGRSRSSVRGRSGLGSAFALIGVVLAGWMCWRIADKAGLPGWTGLESRAFELAGALQPYFSWQMSSTCMSV